MEEWRDIKGYEGIYQVSSLGRVRTLGKWRKFGNRKRYLKPRILSQTLNPCGYYYVTLCKDNHRQTHRIHRLVAIAFLPTNDYSLQVNHKDENKLNNNVDNLEWLSPLDNTRYSLHNKPLTVKEVHQYDLEGNYLATYVSAVVAEFFTGIDHRLINNARIGHSKQAGGYLWSNEKSKAQVLNYSVIQNLHK